MQSKVTLKVGDRFQQAWKGVEKPLWFEVKSINREKNSLKVVCHNEHGFWLEEWDDLDVTENAFIIGEYKMINS